MLIFYADKVFRSGNSNVFNFAILLKTLHAKYSCFTVSVRSEVQIVCIWSRWCHSIPKPHNLLPLSNPDWFTFLVLAYPKIVLEKMLLNRCSSSSSFFQMFISATTSSLKHLFGVYICLSESLNCRDEVQSETKPLVAEPIGPGGRAAARPLFWLLWATFISGLPTFLGDVNFFFLYIAIMTGEKLWLNVPRMLQMAV